VEIKMESTRMKSPYAGLRFAAVAAAFLMVAACSSTDAATDGNASSSSSTITTGTQADLTTNVGDRVFFDTDKTSIQDDGKATLTRQAAWMKLYPNLTFSL